MESLYSSVDTIWTLLGAALVFFMQAGFAMVETGFTRAKNAANIVMKNLMDFCIGTPCYWFIGFTIMFGPTLGGIIGKPDLFMTGTYETAWGTIPTPVFLIFQTVFCATAATIVSGAMAERTKFSSYCLYSAAISLIVYPVSGHWIWGGGWLSELGFHDFAGSTAVHMVGGVAALVGAAILGPRIGKYGPDGKPRTIPGHNFVIGALGVFILWFCWFGFNGGSTVSATGDDTLMLMGKIFVNTNMAAALGAVVAMLYSWIRFGKPDAGMAFNGALAGLVGITAGCDAVSVVGAAIIGIVAGILIVEGIRFIERVVKVDDPVGAVGVHGICGAFGTIAVGLLALDDGVFYGGGFKLLGVQALGVVACAAWVAIAMFLIFTLIKKTVGLRVTAEEEIGGMDPVEHGLDHAYGEFVFEEVKFDD
jgi:Amt family ammonium transporter